MLLMQDLVGLPSTICSTLADATYRWNRGGFAPISLGALHVCLVPCNLGIYHTVDLPCSKVTDKVACGQQNVCPLVTGQRKE